ncbi:MAG: hypothetical protein GAK45_00399 [Pseudomonas citronellolis]|nr:MAG: hypothetical protein GAK45_00399 [Pseudomonas citronellolis]
MRQEHAYTLPELLCSLAIISLLVSFAAPALSQWLAQHRVQVVADELGHALFETRSYAVFDLTPTSLIARDGDWGNGWAIVHDQQNLGHRAKELTPLVVHEPLVGVQVFADRTTQHYVHYLPRGNSVQPNGAFHAGSLRICGDAPIAYKLVINLTGRIRQERHAREALCQR